MYGANFHTPYFSNLCWFTKLKAEPTFPPGGFLLSCLNSVNHSSVGEANTGPTLMKKGEIEQKCQEKCPKH